MAAPVFSGLDNNPTFTEGGPFVTLDDNATVTNSNVADGVTLTLARAGGANPDDLYDSPYLSEIDVTSPYSGLVVASATNSAGTFVIVFNSNATSADLDAILQSLTYADASNALPSSVTLQYVYDNGQQAIGSITVGITSVDNPPTIANVSSVAYYQPGGAGNALSPGILIGDDSGTLASATVSVSAHDVTDSLSANVGSTGIVAAYDANSGILTLTGNASAAAYQQVLASVTYSSSATEPMSFGVPRTVTWRVNDGSLNSDDTNSSLDFYPYLDLDLSGAGTGFSAVFAEGGAGIAIVNWDDHIGAGATNFTFATITIVNAKPGDTLSASGLPSDITADASVPGRLTLNAVVDASASTFEAALRLVVFGNANANIDPATRDVTVTVTDYVNTSNIGHTTITIGGHVIGNGQSVTASAGQTISGYIMSNGGTEYVASGGTASGSVLSSGGREFVSGGGRAVGTTVSDGGFEVIRPGGTVSGTTLTSGGYEYIYSGGSASGTQVASGAIQNVVGSANGTTLDGFEIVFSGAAANSTTIDSGGYQYILPGGSVSGTSVASGGIQNVDGGASGTTVAGFQVIFDSSTASGTHITSTGYQYILPGGTAISTIVDHGGIQNVDGTAINTSLGGFQIIFAGSLASGNVLTSGGYQYILPGGTADGNVLSNGSLQNDDGTALNTTISSGSEQIVFGGSIASNTTVMAGGFEIVVSGGVASNTTISGGFVELGGGNGVGSGGVITFLSGGTLQLDDSQHFNGRISGFAIPDQLDLRDIVYGSNTTIAFAEAPSNTSGTLTVSDGIHSANLLLLGQYVTGNFHITSDGAGGTIVTDPPVSIAGATILADARGSVTGQEVSAILPCTARRKPR